MLSQVYTVGKRGSEDRLKGGKMYKILFGIISSKRRRNWNDRDEDPYKVLDECLYERECSIGTLPSAGKAFRDEVQIDWGSYAWKAKKREIRRFFRRKGYPEEVLEKFDSDEEYGVVYIDS